MDSHRLARLMGSSANPVPIDLVQLPGFETQQFYLQVNIRGNPVIIRGYTHDRTNGTNLALYSLAVNWPTIYQTESDIMLTYESAQRMLGKRPTKKLARNTYLRMEDGNAVIRFWETDVIVISPEDIYTLNSGGYLTTTTKERLNSFSPARISQEKGLWYICARDSRKLFADGVRVDSSGNVIDGTGSEDFSAIMRKVDQLISEDIRALGTLLYPD